MSQSLAMIVLTGGEFALLLGGLFFEHFRHVRFSSAVI
jgi:hypothetical protein